MRSLFSIRCGLRLGLCALVGLGLCGAAPAAATVKKHKKSSSSKATTSKQSSKSKTSGSKVHKTSSSTSKTSRSKKGSKSTKNQKGKKRGQQAIESSRTREIQEALIREHYLQGEPSGSWDEASQAAMKKYQADHGWQSKTTPDSRALIKLGLGPSHDRLLNPESAMTMPTSPAAANSKDAAKPAPAEENVPQQQ
jgi:type IV secretory pathway TrbL component